ncbi:protein kinase [bacterium]|nr:protein kinase [bacterium]
MPNVFTCPSCRGEIDVHGASTGYCPRCRVPLRPPAPTSAGAADDAPTRLAPPPFARAAAAPAAPSDRLARAAEQATDADLALEVRRARTDQARAFGHFVLLSELGKGGMGVVYRAWNDRLRRVVAVKTLLEGGDAEKDLIERFRREAEAVARLRHPNIVSVHEAGELCWRHYMAWSNRGLARAQRGEKEAARADLERSLELEPEGANADAARKKLEELRRD